MEGKIKSFTDLKAWQEAHRLVLEIYEATCKFPKDEIFGLTNQMRRCSVLISSNIAEGFSRPTSKDKSKFYFISLGSTTELQNQLLISKDVKFLAQKDFNNLAQQTIAVHKLINGLIKYLKNT